MPCNKLLPLRFFQEKGLVMMKRKATAAQFDENKRKRVGQEKEDAESHTSFPLNYLPDMVLAIIVRLVDAFYSASHNSDVPVLGSFLGLKDVMAIRRVNVKLRDLASQYNPCFCILQQLENSCTLGQKGNLPPVYRQKISGDTSLNLVEEEDKETEGEDKYGEREEQPQQTPAERNFFRFCSHRMFNRGNPQSSLTSINIDNRLQDLQQEVQRRLHQQAIQQPHYWEANEHLSTLKDTALSLVQVFVPSSLLALTVTTGCKCCIVFPE